LANGEKTISEFTPFLSKISGFQALEEAYTIRLEEPRKGYRQRYELIQNAKALASGLSGNAKIAVQDKILLEDIISDMEEAHGGCLINFGADTIKEFDDYANYFLEAFQSLEQDYGLGIKLSKENLPFDVMLEAFEVNGMVYKTNSYGIDISYATDLIARSLSLRVKKKLDNIIAIEGKKSQGRGVGKSTLGLALATTTAEYNNTTYTHDRNLIFGEKREYVFNFFKSPELKVGDVVIMDEAVNQANKATHWILEQQSLMELLIMIRKKGLTLLWLIPQASDLDIKIREEMLQAVISVPKRGMYIFKLPNLNPSGKTFSSRGDSSKDVVLTANQLIEHTKKFDLNRLFESEFYEIRGPLWETYEDRKDRGIMSKKMIKHYVNRWTHNKTDVMYDAFLASLPNNMSGLSEAMLKDYCRRINYNLSFEGLLRHLSKLTGVKKAEMVRFKSSPGDQDQLAIDVGQEFISNYIKKIKAVSGEVNV
jgi:hypothetical protein